MKTVVALALFVALLGAPFAGVSDYTLSYLYILFFWSALATSWGMLSGLTGYWSFGHGAFYGAGVYTAATLTAKYGVPFLATIPAAAVVSSLLSLGVGLVVFRNKRLRGEFFALLTLSVSFVLAAIVSNTSIDGGAGVFLSAIPVPDLAGSQTGTIYLLGLGLTALTLLASWITSRTRLGLGLAAIHDDEDAAEVKGVPTRRYKLIAFALSSAIAGAAGAIQAIYVGYVTVGETFSITIPLYVVLMSILGGARHWLGPAIGAVLITVALNAVTSIGSTELGKAAVALGLVAAILFLPRGIIPAIIRRQAVRFVPPADPIIPAQMPAGAGETLLQCRDVVKNFGGIRALRGVSLDVIEGEILALVGPNGSGKSTLINMISGHFTMSSGSIALDGRSLTDLPSHAVAGLGVARTYQIPRLFSSMTALDNVALCAVFASGCSMAKARSEALHWLAFTGMTERAGLMIDQMTLHERKFLEFARALAAKPKLLLLDEVLCGLNPVEVDKAVALIREIRAGGTTIVFVEHLMRVVVNLSDRVAVMDQGAVLALGPPQETMRDPRVISIYLGDAHAA